MKTANEQLVRDDLERRYARPYSAGLEEVAVGGLFIGIMLVLTGAVAVGLALAVGAALGWLIAGQGPRSAAHVDHTALPVAGDIRGNGGWRSRHPRSLGP